MVSVTKIFSDLTKGDPRMDGYLLMKTPLEPILIITLYLLFVTKLGPKLMEKRKPFKIKNVLIVYNLAQIALNFLMFLELWKVVKLLPFSSVLCNPVDTSDSSEALFAVKLHYYFVLVKIFDLLDTIFFVLRKKSQQVTYMHIHHHVGIFVAAWISGKYFPVGQSVFTGFFNSFVHSLMYFYYFLTSLDSGLNIWWKKYITIMQIGHQALIIMTGIGSIFNTSCSYPKGWFTLYLLNVMIVMYLFIDFYFKSYRNNNTYHVYKKVKN